MFDLLKYLTRNPLQEISNFLIDSKATAYFIEKAPSNDYYYQLLSNIVTASKMGSRLLDAFEDEPTLKQLLDHIFLIKSGPALRLMLDLCKYYNEKQNTFPLFVHLHKHFNDLCSFVVSDTPFLESKSIAISLIIIHIKRNHSTATKDVTDFTWKLFDQFILRPSNTSLHHSFYTLFKEIFSIDTSIVEKLQIREKIIDLYSKRSTLNATFWGFLYKIIILTHDSESTQLFAQYNKFYDEIIRPFKLILNTPYGGDLPKVSYSEYSENSTEFDSSDYEYEYVTEEEEEELNDKSSDDEDEEEEELKKPFHWTFASLIPHYNISKPLDVKLLTTIQRNKQIQIVKFSPNGRYLSIITEGLLEVLKFSDQSVKFKTALNLPVLTIRFSNDSSHLICCYRSKITIINLHDGSIERTLQIKKCNYIGFSNDSSLITLNSNGNTSICEFPTLTKICSFENESSNSTYTSFSNDLKYVATGYENGTIYLYDIKQKSFLKKIQLHEHKINSIVFTNNYLFTASDESVLKAYSISENKQKILRGHTSSICALDIKNDIMVSGSSDSTINITDVAEAKMEYSIEAHAKPIVDVAFCGGEKLIFASAACDCLVKVWEIVHVKE
ncbi:AChain A, Tako8 [Histomonas meleagridis]|uniref:AChain A, Tako8 n=1 Tax=Histomonas meleagridis TaxID=135588 RepID=UPI00355959AE|nr:AChain A, Tako8 [Histomonas meleagridis]KAH0797908.1 AChain A, Tako8 [Histomonas meleagridis]